MLAGAKALDGLGGVHLSGRRENDSVEFWQLQGIRKLGCRMAHTIFRRRILCLVELTPDERDYLDVADLFNCVEVLEAEGASAGQRGLDGFCH